VMKPGEEGRAALHFRVLAPEWLRAVWRHDERSLC